MLEFCKHILLQVSFDSHLFQKELLKAMKWISSDELHLLKTWCVATFGTRYGEIIRQTFAKLVS